MRLLHRLGYDLALRDTQGRAFVFEFLLGPHLWKDAQSFLPLRASIVGIHLESRELRFRDRASAAELDPSVRQQIQSGDALGHSEGMVDAKRQQHDSVSQPDVLRPCSQMCQY